MSRDYSDHERQSIANEEYSVYEPSDPLTIKNDKGELEDIGTVRQVIENETGIKVYVVESPDQSLLYTISKSVHDIFVKYHKGDAMKSLKIVGIVLASLLVIIGLSVGGYKVMKKVEHDEMVRIVESEEVKKIVENKLKYLDSEALTKEGTIKSYEIDIDSIKHNPMGGIDFKVYVNSDKKLRVMYGLEKDSTTGKIEYSGGGYSAQLAELLKKVKK